MEEMYEKRINERVQAKDYAGAAAIDKVSEASLEMTRVEEKYIRRIDERVRASNYAGATELDKERQDELRKLQEAAPRKIASMDSAAIARRYQEMPTDTSLERTPMEEM